MYRTQSIIPAAQDLAREWVTHATEGTSAQTDAVVRWALARINHADVPSVVHGVMLTLTGNKKAAKEAKRTAARAVRKATQALSRKTTQRSSGRAIWFTAIAAALVGAGAVFAWRTMLPPGEPDPVKQPETPVKPPVPPVP
ncbi:hypothetical protein [Paenarthrobacter aurescens]|uniref:Uncharacterized protein n=1 Tax=Paenarthrobacter aurescens TaxID=43663 RepID=A0A4Y3NE52_PAEAU|nr:hypothetical protein [Paenarthrobacter aurescens]MDO6144990.1 hypothetical protein [Paenarthrobacter aurescens]MDO6148835.1 hypothetical protein [Paenarthrobacter aurescens]MDO6160081.1 hypothetical protein [Paenarthrobacter aurescens]MDO6163940.1 hypothetical protein [Paenarthrobacter aurescens]GEB17348.1 hypothetical protein AAU01_01030 [Paenarthrobacter aurescens]